MQVDPIKPKLKLPGPKRLKLNCGVMLSTPAFKFNLRRYNLAYWVDGWPAAGSNTLNADGSTYAVTVAGNLDAALFEVGRCRMTLSNPR